jgi:hypothetical protein
MMDRWFAALQLIQTRNLATKLASKFHRFYTTTTFISLWNHRLETRKSENGYICQRRLVLLGKTFKRWREVLNMHGKLRQYLVPKAQFKLWLQKVKIKQLFCQYGFQQDIKLKLLVFKMMKFKV